MPPDTLLNERIAAIEPKVLRLETDVEDLHEFKDMMIKEIVELNSNLKTLSWKVSIITGLAVVFSNQLLQLGLDVIKKILP